MTDGTNDLTREEVEHIMRVVDDASFDYVELETDGLKLTIAREGYDGDWPQPQSRDDTRQTPSSSSPTATVTESSHPDITVQDVPASEEPVGMVTNANDGPEGHRITSPMAGIVYRSPSPTSPLFVDVGAVVQVGDTMALVEVMKTFAAVQADVAGTVLYASVDQTAQVTHGQLLFVIGPG